MINYIHSTTEKKIKVSNYRDNIRGEKIEVKNIHTYSNYSFSISFHAEDIKLKISKKIQAFSGQKILVRSSNPSMSSCILDNSLPASLSMAVSTSQLTPQERNKERKTN